MNIELIPLKTGPKFNIFALGINNSCSIIDFMDEARTKYPKEVDTVLAALFTRVAECGPPSNIEKNRKLTDSIWELKTKHLRLLYFYDKGRVIICTNGYIKQGQKTPRRIIHAATEMYRKYQDREQNEIQF